MTEEVRERQREQSQANLDAQRAEHFRTMPLAGIGSAYVGKRFRDYDHGEEVKRLFLDRWPATTTLGYGVTMVGPDPVLGDLQMMMARAAHLAGMVVRVMSLVELGRAVRRGRDADDGEVTRDDLLSVGALFIPRFHDDGDCPVHPYAIAEIMDVVDHLFADNRAVFPWIIHNPLKSWWPDCLMSEIDQRNVNFRIRS